MMKEKFVVDTSIIIDGKVPELLKEERAEEIVVPHVVLDELQAQASRGREEGFLGLDELKKLRKVCKEQEITLSFVGERPSIEDIRLARSGRLDALIRDAAREEGSVLVTANYVQALVGEAEGVETKYVPKKVGKQEFS